MQAVLLFMGCAPQQNSTKRRLCRSSVVVLAMSYYSGMLGDNEAETRPAIPDYDKELTLYA